MKWEVIDAAQHRHYVEADYPAPAADGLIVFWKNPGTSKNDVVGFFYKPIAVTLPPATTPGFPTTDKPYAATEQMTSARPVKDNPQA